MHWLFGGSRLGRKVEEAGVANSSSCQNDSLEGTTVYRVGAILMVQGQSTMRLIQSSACFIVSVTRAREVTRVSSESRRPFKSRRHSLYPECRGVRRELSSLIPLWVNSGRARLRDA